MAQALAVLGALAGGGGAAGAAGAGAAGAGAAGAGAGAGGAEGIMSGKTFGIPNQAISNAIGQKRASGGSKHSMRGLEAGQAKPMEDYATIQNLMNMKSPVHPQLRQQEQFDPNGMQVASQQAPSSYLKNLMSMR